MFKSRIDLVHTKGEASHSEVMKREVEEYVLAHEAEVLIEERKKELDAELEHVADFFHDAGIPFYLAGGTGLDLLNGTWDRDHQDVDVAILGTYRRALHDAAVAQGYVVTDPDRISIQSEDIEDRKIHNVFLFRSDERGISQFEVMFMDQNASGDIGVHDDLVVPRELFDHAPRVPLGGREIRLQPPEIILFHKLLDGRRKDAKDIKALWSQFGHEQQARVQAMVDQSGRVFTLKGTTTSAIPTVLTAVEAAEPEGREQFFDQQILLIAQQEGQELMQKCEQIFIIRETAQTPSEFFEALAKRYNGFLPERRALIEAIARFLYQDPPPSLADFKAWASRHVNLIDRIKPRVLYEFVHQKLWQSERKNVSSS